MWREGGGQGEDFSRGVLYCSTALWWQAGGHFSLLAIRCNAEGSQGYACVATSTGLQSERRLSFRKLVALLSCNVLFIAIEPSFSDLQIPFWILQYVSGFLKTAFSLLLPCTDNTLLLFFFVAELPVIFWQAVISFEHRVWGGGKCHRDVWHGTGRVTFVVNQPPVHPKLSSPGCDNHASLPHGKTEDCRLYLVSTSERSCAKFHWKWIRERPHVVALHRKATATFSPTVQNEL